jgi:hypothetical protein
LQQSDTREFDLNSYKPLFAMNLLSWLVVAILVVVGAERPSLTMQPVDWNFASTMSFGGINVATKKDLLVYQYFDHNANSVVGIRRRNDDGIYEHVADRYFSVLTPFISTNGKWIRVGSRDGDVALAAIDQANNMTKEYTVLADWTALLSDDSLIAVSMDRVNDHFYIQTYQFNAVNDGWLPLESATLIVSIQPKVVSDSATVSVTDSHLIITGINAGHSEVQIYERLGDLSWNLTDTVLVSNASNFDLVTYNNVDTFVYTLLIPYVDYTGMVIFYTKIDDQWVEKTFTVASLGFRAQGLVGIQVVFLDPDNVLITAGLEGYVGDTLPDEAGKVVLISRNSSGEWEPAFDLDGFGVFGFGVGVNDNDIIIPSIIFHGELPNVTFNVLPLCYDQPLNATCRDQQAVDCSQVSLADIYTINNPCGSAINATLTSFTLLNNETAQVQFSVSRYFDENFCNVTVACLAPAIEAPNIGPNFAPVNPSSPTRSVNSANVQSGLQSTLLVALAFVILL